MSEPVKIELTLDLDKHLARFHGYDHDGEPIEGPITVEEVVIEVAAQRLLNSLNRDNGQLAQRVRDIQTEVIREKVTPLVEQAIAGVIQPTDPFGKPKGEPKTLAEVIVAEGMKQMKPSPDAYGRNKTAFDEVIGSHVKATIQQDLKKAVDAARAEVQAAVKEQGAKVLAETIERMAKR